MTEHRRSTDGESDNYAEMRRTLKWRHVFMLVSSLGAVLSGSYIVIGKNDGSQGDSKHYESMILDKLVKIDSNLQNSSYSLKMEDAENEAYRKEVISILREIRTSVKTMANNVAVEDTAVERHGELIMKLEDLEKRTKKR